MIEMLAYKHEFHDYDSPEVGSKQTHKHITDATHDLFQLFVVNDKHYRLKYSFIFIKYNFNIFIHKKNE